MATTSERLSAMESSVAKLKTDITTLKAANTALTTRVAKLEAAQPAPTPVPTPTPTPQPTGWPDALTTGAKGTLTPSGSITTTAHGQVISNKNVTGPIVVRHNGVTIRNCRVTVGNDTAVWVEGDDCVVEDCTLIGGGGAGSRGVWFEGRTQSSANRGIVRRCDISRYEDGVVLGTGSHHKVVDNYLHDPIANNAITDPHIDGIQIHGGSGNFSLIEHNNVDQFSEVSSSITMGNRTAGQGAIGVVVNNNRLRGGTSVIYVEGSDSSGVKLTNNRMGNKWAPGSYFSGTGMGTVLVSGNVHDDTGAPLAP